MKTLKTFCLGLLLMPIWIINDGYCLMLMWNWFLVPIGVAALTLPLALGIDTSIGILFLGVIISQMSTSMAIAGWPKKLERRTIVMNILMRTAMWMMVGIGWITQHFFL